MVAAQGQSVVLSGRLGKDKEAVVGVPVVIPPSLYEL